MGLSKGCMKGRNDARTIQRHEVRRVRMRMRCVVAFVSIVKYTVSMQAIHPRATYMSNPCHGKNHIASDMQAHKGRVALLPATLFWNLLCSITGLLQCLYGNSNP